MKANGNSSVLEPAIHKVANKAHQAVERAERAAGRVAGRAQRAVSPTTQLLNQSCDYVSANPLKALAGAVVVGALLGKIIL